MAADEFDDDFYEGITEEELQHFELKATQQLQRAPQQHQQQQQRQQSRPQAQHPNGGVAPQRAAPAFDNPYEKHLPKAAAPVPARTNQQQQPQPRQQPRPAAAPTTRAPLVPAKRPAPFHGDGHQQQSNAVRQSQAAHGIGSMQPRLPGQKRINPPPFKPPFKKPKTEPTAAHGSLFLPPPPLAQPSAYRTGPTIATTNRQQAKGASADDPIDDLDDDDEFWANVDVDLEEEIATQQVRRAESVAGSQAGQLSPEKSASQQPRPNSITERPAVQQPGVPSDEDARRKADAEARARAKAEEENAKLKARLEQMQRDLWSKQGEDKMLRQRLEKAEADRVTLEKEKERMRSSHQDELRRLNSQKDEDMKRLHDVAQFRAMEAETSRRTPQWPPRRPMPSSVHISGSQYRTPQVIGLRTPTKSAEKRRQEQQERRILSQDSPTRKAQAAGKALPTTFSHFDNSFVVPALPKHRKQNSAAPVAPASKAEILAPETPRAQDNPAFDDYAFEPMVDALSSPARASRPETPKTSPRRQAAPEPVAPDLGTSSASPATWKLWARQVYTIRCSNFISDMLLVSEAVPSPVPYLPRSQLLATRVEPAPSIPVHPQVIHRLIDLRLPQEAHPQAHELWRQAIERLLEVISDGGRHLREGFFVHPSPETLAADAHVVDEAEHIFWSYQEQIDEAMSHLLHILAGLLRVLGCILARLCMLDALQDVMHLMHRMMASSRGFLHAALLPESPVQGLALILDDPGEDRTSQDFRVASLLQPPPFSSFLIELVRKTHPVPLRVSHSTSAPDSALKALPNHGKANVPVNVLEDEGEDQDEAANCAAGVIDELDEIWDIGQEARNEVLAVVAACLRCLSVEDPQTRSNAIAFIEEPGMVMTYIQTTSPPELQEAMMQILLPFSAAQYEWMNVLACNFTDDLPSEFAAMRAGGKGLPLVEMLGKQLSDGHAAWTWEEGHRFHSNALVFLTQLLIHHGDSARTLLSSCPQLVVAIIKTMHRDSSTIWLHIDLVDKTDRAEIERTVDRICMNLQFLCLLSITTTTSVDLAALIRDYEGLRSPFRGLRNLFNVAIGRIGCLTSPDYLQQPDREDFPGILAKLDQAYALANDILDRILTPEEVDALFEEMGAIIEEPEDGIEDDEETQTQDMGYEE
ncbi:hypothetical protein V8E36_001325 [Tilletia maclaganii]